MSKYRSLAVAAPVLAVLLAGAFTALAGGQLYVSAANGSDNNNCRSPNFACKTIGHAISLSSSGDSIVLDDGTYSENLTIPFSLTIRGRDPKRTIVDGGKASTVITIPNAGSRVLLSRVTIRNGLASGDGGGIYNVGILTIRYSIVSSNSSTSGNAGGIYNQGTLTISYSRVDHNYANSGHVGGGGIYNSGILNVDHSTLSRNGTIYGSGGGGIYNGGAGRLTVASSTFETNNDDKGAGGAIYNEGQAAVRDSTFSGNFASWGGGVNNTGAMILANDTFGSNSATFVGGSIDNGGTLLVENTIIANPYNGGNCANGGKLMSKGYNLSSDGSCPFSNVGDLNNADPKLGPLKNYGGPSSTMALLQGSPAINAGNPGPNDGKRGHCDPQDQRGHLRTNRCDIGAYEYP